jgi:hypothetical protein
MWEVQSLFINRLLRRIKGKPLRNREGGTALKFFEIPDSALSRNPFRSKGKAVPLQTWSGPEGSRKLGFTDFMTTARDGGKVVSLTHRPPLPPGNTPGAHFC